MRISFMCTVGTGIMMRSRLDLYCFAIAKIDLTCEATQSCVGTDWLGMVGDVGGVLYSVVSLALFGFSPSN